MGVQTLVFTLKNPITVMREMCLMVYMPRFLIRTSLLLFANADFHIFVMPFRSPNASQYEPPRFPSRLGD